MRALKRAGSGSADPALEAPSRRSCRRGALALIACLAAVLGSTSGTQDAVANGDTRTISIFHEHTKESAAITFKRDGRYDRAALEQLNWLLRDWRLDEPTKMDPRLFDVVWEAHRAVGSQDAIHVVSAYRSPKTNAALRRRSRAVAEHSQHMLGKAMDFYLADVSIDQIRAIGMRMQRGGVGWYPQANSPFVHLDVGSVRSWPRMSHDQLARLFPDGRTVHLPADGRPLAGYESARAEILARGGSVMGVSQAIAAADEEDSPNVVGQFFAMLFGGSKPAAPPPPAPVVLSGRAGRVRPVALASAQPDDAGTRDALAYAAPSAPAALMPQAAPRQAALPEPVQDEAAPAAATPAVVPEPEIGTAEPASEKPVKSLTPLPPRRPSEFAALAEALVASPPPLVVPLPPARPASIQVASASADPAALGAILPPHARTTPVQALAGQKAQLNALFSAAAAAPAAEAAAIRVVQRPKLGTPPAGLVAAPAGAVVTGSRPAPPRMRPGPAASADRRPGGAERQGRELGRGELGRGDRLSRDGAHHRVDRDEHHDPAAGRVDPRQRGGHHLRAPHRQHAGGAHRGDPDPVQPLAALPDDPAGPSRRAGGRGRSFPRLAAALRRVPARRRRRGAVSQGRPGRRDVPDRGRPVPHRGARPGDPAGAIVGELGMLSPGNLRTGTLVCIEPGIVLGVAYADVKQLYYQNPEFGFYFLKLTSERLFQAAQAVPARAPAGTDII